MEKLLLFLLFTFVDPASGINKEKFLDLDKDEGLEE